MLPMCSKTMKIYVYKSVRKGKCWWTLYNAIEKHSVAAIWEHLQASFQQTCAITFRLRISAYNRSGYATFEVTHGVGMRGRTAKWWDMWPRYKNNGPKSGILRGLHEKIDFEKRCCDAGNEIARAKFTCVLCSTPVVLSWKYTRSVRAQTLSLLTWWCQRQYGEIGPRQCCVSETILFGPDGRPRNGFSVIE